MSTKKILNPLLGITLFSLASYSTFGFSPDSIEKVDISETSAYQRLELESNYVIISESAYQNLDALLEDAKNDFFYEHILSKESLSEKDASALFASMYLLLEEHGFTMNNEILFSEGLSNKNYDCDLSTTLYRSILEMYGVDSTPVLAPTHVFLRVTDSDAGQYVNIETLNGELKTDTYFINLFNIPAISLKNGTYLRSLNDEESKAIWLEGIADYFRSEILYATALPLYEEVLDVVEFDITLGGMGDIYFELGNYEKAISYYNQSIELNPNFKVSYECKERALDAILYLEPSIEFKLFENLESSDN